MLLSLEEFIARRLEHPNDLWAIENKIVAGDCLLALPHLPSSSVDLIHTSPPYNIDKAYKGSHGDRKETESYLGFLQRVIAELKRVLKPNGSLFWQTGYTQMENGFQGDIIPIDVVSYQFFRTEPNSLILWDRIIWRYFGGMAFKKKYTNRHETIFWFVKPHEEQVNPCFDVDCVRERSREMDKRNNFWGRNPGNVWEVDRVAYGSIEQSSHIAVYPEEIAEKIIRASSKPGDLVLDPFSGSGTTPKVAHSLGRRWIGIEISPEYAKESVKRIGFQQPSEHYSLVSAIIKEKVFTSTVSALPVDEVTRRLRLWARSIDIAPSRGRFDAAMAKVYHSPAGRDRKPEIWEQFEQLIHSGAEDPVVEADRFLLADYKNRRNQNGVFRYRSALHILENALLSISDASDTGLSRFVQEIIEHEPSSYRLHDGKLSVVNFEKRLKRLFKSTDLGLVKSQDQLDFQLQAAHHKNAEQSESEGHYQARLPM